MERADVEDALRSLDEIRLAYRSCLERGEEDTAEDLAEIIDTAERWLLRQIGGDT